MTLSPRARTARERHGVRSLQALLLLFVLAAAFLWKVVLLGRVLAPADVLLVMTPWKFYARERFPEFRQAQNGLLDPVQQYYPWRRHATSSLKEGVIPLWNPYMFCGTPFVANQQSTVFYPPNLLFLLTSVAKGFGVSTLLHLTLLGWGTFLFLRELGLRRGAALVGAIAFTFNGYVVAWLEFPAFSIWVATWLPWTLWLFERAWRSAVGGRRSAVRNPKSEIRNPGLWVGLCGAVWGLQFLGGQLQVSFYLLLTFGSYGLFRILTSRGTEGDRRGRKGTEGDGKGKRGWKGKDQG